LTPVLSPAVAEVVCDLSPVSHLPPSIAG